MNDLAQCLFHCSVSYVLRCIVYHGWTVCLVEKSVGRRHLFDRFFTGHFHSLLLYGFERVNFSHAQYHESGLFIVLWLSLVGNLLKDHRSVVAVFMRV